MPVNSDVRPHNLLHAMPHATDTDRLFVELGRALYLFQAIELRIKVLLPHLNVPGRNELPDGEGVKGWRKYLDSKEMLGNLVRLLQERVSVEDPESLGREWRAVVQCRNEVVHSFAVQPFARCETPEDVECSIEYIRVRARRAVPFLQILQSLLHAFAAATDLPPDLEGEILVESPT